MKKTILEGAREVPVLAEVDVLVLGAGPAGVSAAICAAREGVNTMLVEQSGDVGGVATTGLMSHWTGNTHGGFYEELLTRTAELSGDETGMNGGSRQIINPESLKTRLLEMLEQITAGNGTVELLREMEELCYYIKANSLCALGQSAPNPVLSTLHYFRDEYEAHCIEKRCPAGVCKRLVRFVIEEDKCKGCTACARACPVNAISGEVRKPHQIDTRKCIKCGACMETCRFDAIVKR